MLYFVMTGNGVVTLSAAGSPRVTLVVLVCKQGRQVCRLYEKSGLVEKLLRPIGGPQRPLNPSLMTATYTGKLQVP